MSLSTYALASVDELKQKLSISPEQAGQDVTLENILNRASEAIEAFLGRHIVTRGAKTEYHTVSYGRSRLVALQFPVISVTSVKEGAWSAGTWTAAATLTVGTDYVQDATTGLFIRLSACWHSEQDGVQLVYSGGYASTAAVPAPIKAKCLAIAAREYSQLRRGGDFAAQTISDAAGSVTRFLPAELLRSEQADLVHWKTGNYAPTGRVA
jgi:hypothetical protein